MKKIIAIRHIHFEDLGTWEMTLKMRFQAAEIEYVDAPIADFSDTEKFLAADLLVVLGAPIGAFDEAIYPFLARELVVIDARLKSGNPLIGVCLGAQIIARLSGANVEPMSVKEIGFAPISACGVLAELDSEKVLHWHGDRFELPENAQHLSGSQICDNQAFSIGNNVLGLQFHLEADTHRIENWLLGHANELSAAQISPEQIRQDAKKYGAKLAQLSERILNHWLDNIQVA